MAVCVCVGGGERGEGVGMFVKWVSFLNIVTSLSRALWWGVTEVEIRSLLLRSQSL